MEAEKYLEGNMIVKPPYFEYISFLEWKINFENFVKSIDIDLWHIISRDWRRSPCCRRACLFRQLFFRGRTAVYFVKKS